MATKSSIPKQTFEKLLEEQKGQETSEATEGDQTESVKQPVERPAEQPNSNQDLLLTCLTCLVGGVVFVGLLSAFGYQAKSQRCVFYIFLP